MDISKLHSDYNRFSEEWIDTPEYNQKIYSYFEEQVDKYDFLVKHIDVVTNNQLGYGEKAFRYLWLLVFAQMQKDSKFLEIGVYKGSILALSQLCTNSTIKSYGLTPLDNVGDKYSNYVIDDYEQCIARLYHLLDLTTTNTTIIPGLSTNEEVKKVAEDLGSYDVLYIDGGHDYNTVVNDIILAEKILKKDGILVMDDASSLLQLGSNHKGFDGHYEVGLAIKDYLDHNKFKHLFACGHNRVWKKLI